MKTLQLAPNLSLPLTAVTSTFGLLAVRGAGKSNTAAVMAEAMFDAGLPFVAIDPVGSWYGLRSGADGNKTGGLPIPIFGGRHGDLPLQRDAGELIADLVTSKRLSCVLDLSEFSSEGDKKAFLLAFARRLYQKNTDPLHLFLEEADDYIPQRPMRDEALLLRAWENIVRRGRSRGIGITLITQRSAAVNKSVLTQVETLFAMRTTGPQDVAAIEAWVKYQQVDGNVVRTLAGLAPGEAWVWSPHFLKTMERVQIRRRRTFDSGATPKNVTASAARKPATLADVDLDAVKGQMQSALERAQADDPKVLRAALAEKDKRIKELERVASGSRPPVQGLSQADRELVANLRAEIRSVYSDLDVRTAKVVASFEHRLQTTVRALVESSARDLETLVETGRRRFLERLDRAKVRAVLDKTDHPVAVRAAVEYVPRTAPKTVPSVRVPDLSGVNPDRIMVDDAGDLGSGAAARILAVVKQYPGAEARRVGALAGVSSKLSTFRVAIAKLRALGYIEGDRSGFRLTMLGAAAAAHVPAAPTGREAVEHWQRELGDGAARRLFDVLLASHMRPLTAKELGHDAGVDPSLSTFRVALAKLRNLELVEGGRGGMTLSRGLFE